MTPRFSQPDVPVALSEEPRQYLLKVDLPGWARENVGVRVDGGTLQILNPRQNRHPREGVMSEVALPRDVDPCSVVADFRDGVLRVRLPRMARKRSWWPC